MPLQLLLSVVLCLSYLLYSAGWKVHLVVQNSFCGNICLMIKWEITWLSHKHSRGIPKMCITEKTSPTMLYVDIDQWRQKPIPLLDRTKYFFSYTQPTFMGLRHRFYLVIDHKSDCNLGKMFFLGFNLLQYWKSRWCTSSFLVTDNNPRAKK